MQILHAPELSAKNKVKIFNFENKPPLRNSILSKEKETFIMIP